jgi:hypothetical protein
MRTKTSILMYALIASVLIGFSNATPSLITCSGTGGIFTAAYAGGPNNTPGLAGQYSGAWNYAGMSSIILLIVTLDFGVMAVAYAIGMGFQIQSLTNFAKTEMLEGVFNVAILATIGFAVISVYPAMVFFLNVAQLNTAAPVIPASTGGIYVSLCNDISTNIINSGFNNWIGLTGTLFLANTLQSVNVLAIPNSYGYAYQPFAGLALLVQLLWDDQTAFFGTMFFGMFLVVMLFVIYYLFPIFLYVGLALRAFPWTRAAGGSFVAMFIAFYVIFPALMLPFVTNTSAIGVCNPPMSGSGYVNPLCNPGSFSGHSLKSILTFTFASNFNFGEVYYDDVVAFVDGFFTIGLNMFGLVIALLISYEIVEKIGSILGAPSMSAQRALSRIL